MLRPSLKKWLRGPIAAALLAPAASNATPMKQVSREGKDYVSIRDTARAYGFPAKQPILSGSNITLKSQWSTIIFEANSRKASYNGTSVWLAGPTRQHRRQWMLSKDDFEKVVTPLLRPDDILSHRNSRVIVLDPGHGGKDNGAQGRRGLREKDLTLDVAQRIRKMLAADGLMVKLTRERDEFLTLDQRWQRADRWRADVFVSIHFNSATPSASGVETFVLPPSGWPSTSGTVDRYAYPANKHDEANLLLGYFVQKETVGATGQKDRGVRRARFHVIKNVNCPSALVECGFVSHPATAAVLSSDTYRDTVATGLGNGVRAYVKQVQRARRALR